MNTGINRIRLEFKVLSLIYLIIHNVVLIESDWNLKFGLTQEDKDDITVLIESDWNLKIAGKAQRKG